MKHEAIDVLIVGAGPAGLSAALELKRLGVENIVVAEREAEAGGIPRLCHHTGFGIRDLHRVYIGPRYARHYVEQAKQEGIDVRTKTTITGWDDAAATKLGYSSPQGIGVFDAKAVLLATGVRERPRAARLVPGNRPAGIFTTGSLQRFVYGSEIPVGKRAVIVGAELVSLSAVMTLRHAGVGVVAMTTKLSAHQLMFPYNVAKWGLMDVLGKTPIYTLSGIQEIVGDKRVRSVRLSNFETGKTTSIECDTVVFTGNWIPEDEIARMGGIKINSGTLGPQVDSRFRTSQRGIFAAGNLLHGAETADISALEGRSVASSIKDFLISSSWASDNFSIKEEAALDWLVPNSIFLDKMESVKRLRFRVKEVLEKPTIRVYQGRRLLYAQTFRKLLPGNTYRLSAHWITEIDSSVLSQGITVTSEELR